MIVDNNIITFYKKDNLYKIEIRDINSNQDYYAVKTFEYESDVVADEGSLVVVGSTIYIAPHNKQLNLINGVWSISDFVSTSPLLLISDDNTDNGVYAGYGYIKILEDATRTYSAKMVVGSYQQTISVVRGDSKFIIAEKIRNAYATILSNLYNVFINDSLVSNYIDRVLLNNGEIVDLSFISESLLEYISSGDTVIFASKFNNQLQPSFISFDYPYTDIKHIEGGTPDNFGDLEQAEEFWYKARYVFYDGHITKTGFPRKILTTNERKRNHMAIEPAIDLDGRYAFIEVFRKKGAGNFFLIEKVKPEFLNYSGYFEYVDDGKTDIEVLTEQEYVWSAKHKTHEAVADRYVRANIEYKDRSFVGDFQSAVIRQDTESEVTLPPSCDFELFAKVKFEDGLESFHQKIFQGRTSEGFIKDSVSVFGNTPIDFFDSSFNLKITQNSLIEDAKEVGYYARYKSYTPEQELKIPSLELYNNNIASIATNGETLEEQDKPLNPHIFLGWKYILRGFLPTKTGLKFNNWIFDKDWNTNPSENDNGSNLLLDKFILPLGTFNNLNPYPNFIEVEVFPGYPQKYKKRYSLGNGLSIYELAIVEPLKDIIDNKRIKIKLNSVQSGLTLSSSQPNKEYVDLEVNVIGVEDKSQEYDYDYKKYSTFIVPAKNSRIYLVLETGTIYDDINGGAVNAAAVKGDFEKNFAPNRANKFEFSLIGLEEAYLAQNDSNLVDDEDVTVYEFDYVISDYNADTNDSLIFLYGKENETDNGIDLNHTGYIRKRDGKFLYFILDDTNIYESLIQRKELTTVQTQFPNQIIWSERYSDGNNSGTRNFTFTNFLNIATDYGQILRIVYGRNVLLVFCERGVMAVNVGEVLAQSTGDNNLILSSTFLNSPQWILKNTRKMSPRSIVKYNDMVIFADEKDVWMFADGLKQISANTVPIFANSFGAIDNKNNEYRITSNGKTWAYSFETGEWFGPYTYADKISAPFSERMFSVVGEKVVEHNIGNEFGSSEYETKIESVANNFEDASVDKLFRKFYVESDDATFEYSKDYTNWTTKELSNARELSGVKHIGVADPNKTARQLYWRIKSSVENFLLKMVSFEWTPRQRR